jgi:hypothetical protein
MAREQKSKEGFGVSDLKDLSLDYHLKAPPLPNNIIWGMKTNTWAIGKHLRSITSTRLHALPPRGEKTFHKSTVFNKGINQCLVKANGVQSGKWLPKTT